MIYIFYILIILVIGAGLIIFLLMMNKYLNRREDRLEREYYSSLDINESKLKLLDNLIEIEFQNYIHYHPGKFDVNGMSYIKEEEFSGIITAISTNVFLRITPAIRENIKLVYNYEKDADIIKIIGNKVGLNLALAASEINSAIIDEGPTTLDFE